MLRVIGFGPGGYEYMTIEAKEAMEASDLIVGYTVYADLVREYFPGKEYYTTPMKQETERCRYALTKAREGREVAVVCSGDSGVYGMASLLCELAGEEPGTTLKFIAGVTAACSGGAVLGAPLSHDFAVISLSDLLTPMERIRQRIALCAQADMVLCIYNPSSRKRKDYLKEACDIILQYQAPDTVCGYVKQIGREGEEAVICTLREMRETQVDMFTTVYIGSSQTKKIGNWMVTPRGYHYASV
ncbi:precorrin-3B C(17)-methyltransferase [Diplocloster hominis]|uniref:precorrin-3B C(17)-methyltransferase n=1 Tax=Diplocloster hominis TaxID=3079010 RepID=UPI0031BBB62C